MHDDYSPRAEAAYYRPQLPEKYRDDRSAEERLHDERERRRLDEERRYAERRYESRREMEERRYEGAKQEGKNYRKELLERFADMDLEDHHDYRPHQRYYE